MTVSIGIHVIGLARLSRVSLGDSVEAHLRACRLASETYAMLHGRVQAAVLYNQPIIRFPRSTVHSAFIRSWLGNQSRGCEPLDTIGIIFCLTVGQTRFALTKDFIKCCTP